MCVDVKTALSNAKCPEGQDRYCTVFRLLAEGKDCDQLSGPPGVDVCQFLHQGAKITNLSSCEEEEAGHFKNKDGIKKPSFCAIGQFVKRNFIQMEERRNEARLRKEFTKLVKNRGKPNCFTRRTFGSSLTKLITEEKGAALGVPELTDDEKKVIELAVQSFPLISKFSIANERNKFTITQPMVMQFFDQLVKGLGVKENREQLLADRPKLHEKGSKIGNFTLPCAIQTRADGNDFFLYLERMEIPEKGEISLLPSTGNQKSVSLALSYSDAQPLVKLEIGGVNASNTRAPTREAIEDLWLETEIAQTFQNERYFGDIKALYGNAEKTRLTAIQTYYPYGGEEIHNTLRLGGNWVDGLPKDQFLTQLGLHLFEGLEAMHTKKLIHRDMKPDNIRLSRNEEGTLVPKIIDFGAATDIYESRGISYGHVPALILKRRPSVEASDIISGSPSDAKTEIPIEANQMLAWEKPSSNLTQESNQTASENSLVLSRKSSISISSLHRSRSDVERSPSQSPQFSPRLGVGGRDKDGSPSWTLADPRYSPEFQLTAITPPNERPASPISVSHGGTVKYMSPEYFESYNSNNDPDPELHNPRLDTWASVLSLYEIKQGGLSKDFEKNDCPGNVYNYEQLKEKCGIDCLSEGAVSADRPTLMGVICKGLNPAHEKRLTPSDVIREFKKVLDTYHSNSLEYDLFTGTPKN